MDLIDILPFPRNVNDLTDLIGGGVAWILTALAIILWKRQQGEDMETRYKALISFAFVLVGALVGLVVRLALLSRPGEETEYFDMLGPVFAWMSLIYTLTAKVGANGKPDQSTLAPL